MPHGGLEESGVGKEGPRCTLEKMTELKLVILPLPGCAPAPDDRGRAAAGSLGGGAAFTGR